MILVTGGAGFIGSHLVEALLRRGHKVRILDNLSTGKKENLAEATGHPLEKFAGISRDSPFSILDEKVEFFWGDLRDINICRKACQGISCVFHLAALGSVQRSVEDPLTSHQVNTTGTLNILLAARDNQAKRLVYASSSSVYGNPASSGEAEPKKENLPPQPQSPYAVTKMMGENYCRIFSHLYGLETVTLRYFNVFGPRQDPTSIYSAVIPKFITAAQKGESPVIYGDGTQSRDFTFVENVTEANLLAMDIPGVSGQVFNIACGQQTAVNDLLSILQDISGRKTLAKYVQPRKGEVRHSWASIQLAKTILQYNVKVGIREGLSATWNWFQKNRG